MSGEGMNIDIFHRDRKARERAERLAEYREPKPSDPCLKSEQGAHHWDIDSKNQGICRYCGEEKVFSRTKSYRDFLDPFT